MPDNNEYGGIPKMCGELKRWRFGTWKNQLCHYEQYFVCEKKLNSG